jgi:hypothetical protein
MFLVVKSLVLLVSGNVIDCLLDESDHEHKSQGSNVGEEEADSQSWHELRQRYQQEEQIVKELELVEEDHGQERQQIVLIIL